MNSQIGRSALCALLPLCASVGLSAAEAAVQVSTKPTQYMSCANGVCSATAKDAVLNVNDLTGMLANGDVTIQSGKIAKDIIVKAAFSWTSSQRLTFDSYHSILFARSITVAGTGAVTIITNDGGADGDFRFAARGNMDFWDTTSDLAINGDHYELVASMKQLSSRERQDNSGKYALAKSVNAARHTYQGSPMTRTFVGSLEGLGNTISNLTLQGTDTNGNVGLIGEFAPSGNGVVRDLHLKSVSVKATASEANVGSLVGLLDDGSIINVEVDGDVSGSGAGSIVGGVIGLSIFGTIRQSASSANVSGTEGAVAVGGLIGEDEDGCVHCIGILDSNFATGTVTGGDSIAAGGLIGQNLGASLSNSYARGPVSGGNNSSVGGLVGMNADSVVSGVPAIATSYSTGSVSGGSGASVGGFVGQDQVSSSIANAYWDLDTSGISDPAQGAGNVSNDPGIMGLTTSQLTSSLPSGFDPKVWGQSPTINGGYPFLLAVTAH